MTIEEDIHEILSANNQTLSTAESCTGGAIAASLTAIPGSSQYFKGGVVAYSNEIKTKFLGVQEKTLSNFGAVSEEVVSEMALGGQKGMDTDYCIAVSGIAGPSGGSQDKPVGTVCAAIAERKALVKVWTMQLNGERGQVIESGREKILQEFKLYLFKK